MLRMKSMFEMTNDERKDYFAHQREQVRIAIKRQIELDKSIVTPAFDGTTFFEDYGVCSKTSKVYSRKRGNQWIELTPNVSGNTKYPAVKFSVKGKSYTKEVHRIVAWTLQKGNPLPRPNEISSAAWKKTPKEVKDLIARQLYEVNHIDHVHTNYHISNLEFVTRRQNVQKYHAHRKNA